MFKLAAHLGKTVGELNSLPYDEFVAWRAFDEIDPIGGYRMDLNFAMMAYLQAGEQGKTLADFLVVDPNPLSDEAAALIALFNS